MPASTASLFAEHRGPLFRYLCRATGQIETAQDLTQEVFLRISRTAVPAASEDDIRAWLFRIARNLVIDHHRRRARAPEVALSSEPTPRAPSQDTALAVANALDALADVDRDVFLMRELGGLSYGEIATACELTPDAVRSRIHRARLQLREQLAAPIGTHRTSAMRLLGGRRPSS